MFHFLIACFFLKVMCKASGEVSNTCTLIVKSPLPESVRFSAITGNVVNLQVGIQISGTYELPTDAMLCVSILPLPTLRDFEVPAHGDVGDAGTFCKAQSEFVFSGYVSGTVVNLIQLVSMNSTTRISLAQTHVIFDIVDSSPDLQIFSRVRKLKGLDLFLGILLFRVNNFTQSPLLPHIMESALIDFCRLNDDDEINKNYNKATTFLSTHFLLINNMCKFRYFILNRKQRQVQHPKESTDHIFLNSKKSLVIFLKEALRHGANNRLLSWATAIHQNNNGTHLIILTGDFKLKSDTINVLSELVGIEIFYSPVLTYFSTLKYLASSSSFDMMAAKEMGTFSAEQHSDWMELLFFLEKRARALILVNSQGDPQSSLLLKTARACLHPPIVLLDLPNIFVPRSWIAGIDAVIVSLFFQFNQIFRRFHLCILYRYVMLFLFFLMYPRFYLK